MMLDEPAESRFELRGRRGHRGISDIFSVSAVGPREEHAARVFGPAEPSADLGERQLLEFSQQDDLAMGRQQRFESLLELLGLLPQDHAGKRGPGQRRQRCVVFEGCFARRIAPLPVMEMCTVPYLVFSDPCKPRHHRSGFVGLELAHMVE
jgi:hypothetical protein